MTATLARIEPRQLAPLEFSEDQRKMIRDTFLNGATDQEAGVLMEVAKARRLNPLTRQIHFIKRWDSQKRCEVWSAQVAIDGLRAIAERTGLYDGQDEPEFEEDAKGITLCRVRVYRKDWTRPAVGVAHWAEYAQTTKDGSLTSMWARGKHFMLAKCAEAIALRRAFPEDTSGLYVPEELGSDGAMREEKELNPAPPFSRPDVKPPERPAVQGGVRSVVEKLKAKKEAQAPLIVDVAEGESEEEAEAKAKDVGPCIEGGQLDGTPIMNLTTDELLTIASKTENYLRANPNGKHAGLMRRNMLAVSSEIDTRAQAESEVAPQ